MRLSKRIVQNLDADSVRRVNEIYHDLENTLYDRQHEDISKFEREFWRDAAREYLDTDEPVTWLDYGTGTGFVPFTIAGALRQKDTLMCCDISAEMLKLCQVKLEHAALPCRCIFSKINRESIPAENGSVDIISVNSVLHHLFDLHVFATECERVLKPGGKLIVAHEPNKTTQLAPLGRLVRGLANTVLRPRSVVFKIAESSALAERCLRRATSRLSERYRRRNRMLADVARHVQEEHLLDVELRGTEIQQIVDFQSQHGFDRNELLGNVFGQFNVASYRTYGHLGFFPEGRLARALDAWLRARWPDAGREICFVLRLK